VAKNKATAGRYKDLVRVVKNLRQETIGVLLSWPVDDPRATVGLQLGPVIDIPATIVATDVPPMPE